MKITFENISAVKKKMRIEVDAPRVAEELVKATVKLQKTARIPGFRPGKATKDAIERHYGEELKAEVLQHIMAEAYQQAMKEQDFVAVSAPKISDLSELNKDKTLTFSAAVDVRPTVELGDYTTLEVRNPEIAVTTAEVDEALEHLREMHTRLEVSPEEMVGRDHTAIIDFEGFHAGKPLPLGKATDFILHLGRNLLLPEFEEQVAGMRRGDTKDIKVVFPDDYATKDLAGKDVTFSVTLKEIKKTVLPDLNDDLAAKVGGLKTMEELQARIQEDLEAKKRSELVTQQKDDILATLIERHSFDVPESLVEQELNYMVGQQKFYLQGKGQDAGGPFDEAEFRSTNLDMAVKRVKGIVILQDIAEKEGITVSDSDVSAAMASLARTTGQKLEQIFKYYESREGGLDNLRESLLAEKTLAFLFSKARKV